MPGMVMLTHKLRMTVRTKRQRETLYEALETSRLLYARIAVTPATAITTLP